MNRGSKVLSPTYLTWIMDLTESAYYERRAWSTADSLRGRAWQYDDHEDIVSKVCDLLMMTFSHLVFAQRSTCIQSVL
jgi:hypothetical protein